MNPMIRLYRRSRIFRLGCYLLLVAVWAGIFFVSIDSLEKYIGNVAGITALTLTLLFAIWAWWYGEDRNRRQRARAATDDTYPRVPDADVH
jgi:peptidoglycan/LPS O-acetylase OafA/YrhL